MTISNYLVAGCILISSIAGCSGKKPKATASGSTSLDVEALNSAISDTGSYRLAKVTTGGVFGRTELYVKKEDTSRSYIKVFSTGMQVQALQFYRNDKKEGPTITYFNGSPQLYTYYQDDTIRTMRNYKNGRWE